MDLRIRAFRCLLARSSPPALVLHLPAAIPCVDGVSSQYSPIHIRSRFSVGFPGSRPLADALDSILMAFVNGDLASFGVEDLLGHNSPSRVLPPLKTKHPDILFSAAARGALQHVNRSFRAGFASPFAAPPLWKLPIDIYGSAAQFLEGRSLPVYFTRFMKSVASGMSLGHLNIICLGTAAGFLCLIQNSSKQDASNGCCYGSFRQDLACPVPPFPPFSISFGATSGYCNFLFPGIGGILFLSSKSSQRNEQCKDDPYGLNGDIPDGKDPLKEIMKLLKKTASKLSKLKEGVAHLWKQWSEIVSIIITDTRDEIEEKLQSYLRRANKKKDEGHLAEVTIAYSSFDLRTKQVHQMTFLSTEVDESIIRGLLKDIQTKQPSLPGPLHPGLLSLLRGHEDASLVQFLGSLTKQDERPSHPTRRPKLPVAPKRVKKSSVKESSDRKLKLQKPTPSVPWRIGT